MKVYNMTSPKGTIVPNQFIINDDGILYFQSYNTVIVKIDSDKNIFLDKNSYDYSKTTAKYRNLFLGVSSKEFNANLKNGQYQLVDLNS